MLVYNLNTEKETDLQKFNEHMKSSSPLFQAVEQIFHKWIEESNPANEYEDMYFSENAIYDKRGAIRGAIHHIFETMDECELNCINLNDSRLDWDACFS